MVNVVNHYGAVVKGVGVQKEKYQIREFVVVTFCCEYVVFGYGILCSRNLENLR